jgi:hypothetical protein
MNPQEIFEDWYETLRQYGGFPAKGTISGALVVLEHLKENYNLEIDAHTAQGGSQIKGASGTAVRQILARFGETRAFVSEGGRTNRGLRGDVHTMLNAIGAAKLETLSAHERNRVLEGFQRFLVDRIRDFHNRQRLNIIFDPSKSTRQIIQDLLTLASETGKKGPVAQYLVGAKLQLRFSGEEIGNESYSTADMQLDRPGDFLIGNTVFHVTVALMPGVYDKCQRNLTGGYRVYLLVPDEFLEGARQNAKAIAPGQIAVESIESFVAQNVEELSEFSDRKLPKQFSRLLEIYNQRVDATEIDKSMMIEIPRQLLH